MDHRGKKLLGFFAATFGILTTAWAAGSTHPLREMAWLSVEGRIEALTTEPSSGFRINANSLDESDTILSGEALFHAPSLLGGQAAKAGISCASCHVNGRDNPNFQFPGVSGAPGTADVTHSFFSSHRGDGSHNPITIPDLTKTGKISKHNEGELEEFIRGLVVEEFNGAEPAQATLHAVTSYVRALCDVGQNDPVPITLQTHWARTERAILMAEKFHVEEPEMARLLLSNARHQLGLVHERYTGRKLAKERQQLLNLSERIKALQNIVGTSEKSYRDLAKATMDQMIETKKMLKKSEKQSLYNVQVLTTLLNEPSPRP
ncbi:MAG: hypothetical protein ABJN65_15770 [Parasphingorhabdus sp.]